MKKILSIVFVLSVIYCQAGTVYTLSVGSSGLSTRNIFNTNVQGTINPQAGDTLDIPSGYGDIWNIALENITAGTALNPVVITCRTSSTLLIGGNTAYAFKINYSKNVKIVNLHFTGRGTGDGVQSSYDVDGIWFDHCTVKNTAGPGFFIKCVGDSTNTKSYYPQTLKNMKITGCRVDSSGTESFYCGSTFANEHQPYLAAYIDGLYLDQDSSFAAGWDGLQITNAVTLQVTNIYVRGAGRLNASGQRSCITIQDNVLLRNAYSWDVADCPGTGVFIKCRGTVVIDNVKISNVATATPNEAGVYADDKPVLLYDSTQAAGYHIDTTMRLVLTNLNINNTNGSKALLIRNLQGTERAGIITVYYANVPASPITDNGGNTITVLSTPPYSGGTTRKQYGNTYYDQLH